MAKNKIAIASNVLQQAKQNNQDALKTMFQQFLGTDEEIKFAEYMGQHGILISVTHSFACLTNKKIISLKVGSFGQVLYQDAFTEDLNSGAIYQPSLLGLYILFAIVFIFSYPIVGMIISFSVMTIFPSYMESNIVMVISNIFIFGIIILLLQFTVKWYYKIKKCGIVFIIKEGLSVYIFVNRNRMSRANALWRLASEIREERKTKYRV